MSTHPLWRPFELVDLADAAAVRVGNPKPRTVSGSGTTRRGRAATRRVRKRSGRARDRASRSTTSARPRCPGWRPSRCSTSTYGGRQRRRGDVPPGTGGAGFGLRLREPASEEHRLFTDEHLSVNLHVWSPGTPEPQRHLLFRDFLRATRPTRRRTARSRPSSHAAPSRSGMDYNNQKAAVVYDLYEQASPPTPRTSTTRGPGPRAPGRAGSSPSARWAARCGRPGRRP